MKKQLIFCLIIFLALTTGIAAATENHSAVFSRAKEIISSKKSCDFLSDSDLEALGEYFMEQMHPGEEHELMDARMGGEGSEALRQAHIRMGTGFYCRQSGRKYTMMGEMMGMRFEGYSKGSMVMWFFYWICAILILLILILIFIFLVKKINEKGGKRK
ncbi:hypothetical protein D6829_02805 [Candidatus Pacearchaeota archaeon]|nr:MAG: hypothetical protein D6829_02805 [Candidatus Pacearchaeota archaeon]